jgi:hypothetical protein
VSATTAVESTAVESVATVSTALPPQDARTVVAAIANNTKIFLIFFVFFYVLCFLLNLS